ncbi:hypothetical protein [Candidatus Laterigemmans baculatus]|uniref:hypothetical protein n=1 Tax=Candidatus Laterigemmans baculatus TaxID=2770505 RepID=UPI0013DB8629|nr:hypothetical protein [Candidatus Laterigemmans baculatus]
MTPTPTGQAIPAMRPQSSLAGAELEAAIGRLVREALREQLGPNHSASHIASHIASHPPADRPSDSSAAARMAESVISLRTLEGLGEEVKRLELAPRAVVTPAAADQLRHRGIEVVRGAAVCSQSAASQPLQYQSVSAGAAATTTLCWIADANHAERTAAYVRQLASRGLSVASVASLPRSAAEVPPGIGVVISDLPALQVDHFARQLSIPSAAVTGIADVGRIAAAFVPRIWVLDAERLSFSGRVAVAAECVRLAQTTKAEGASITDAASAAERRRPR